MYASVKLFTISLHTFEIPDFVRFQSPENGFSFSNLVRPLIDSVHSTSCFLSSEAQSLFSVSN